MIVIVLVAIASLASLLILRLLIRARRRSKDLASMVPLYELSSMPSVLSELPVTSPVQLTTWKRRSFDSSAQSRPQLADVFPLVVPGAGADWNQLAPKPKSPTKEPATNMPTPIPSMTSLEEIAPWQYQRESDEMFLIDLATPNISERKSITTGYALPSTASTTTLKAPSGPWLSMDSLSVSSSIFDRSSARNSGRDSQTSEYSLPLPNGKQTYIRFASPLSWAAPYDDYIKYGSKEYLV